MSAEVLRLSSAFYSLVPHVSTDGQGGTRARLPPLATLKQLQAKRELLEALGNIEVASKAFGPTGARDERHALDVQYEALGTALVPLERSSEEWALIERYTRQTHASMHSAYALEVVDIFEVSLPVPSSPPPRRLLAPALY